MSLTVGQVLWCVPTQRHNGSPREVTVTKVGRKWAELGRGEPRVNTVTLALDGGKYASPGQCYFSRELYAEALELSTAWNELRTFMRNTYGPPPPHLGVRGIRQVLAMLKGAP